MTQELETRFIESPLEVRADQQTRKIIGLAAPYWDGRTGSEYQLAPGVYERFAPGCFGDALGNIELRYQHQRTAVLASVPHSLRLWSEASGLKYEAILNRSTPANDALALVESQDIKGNSVGMIVQEEKWQRDGNKEIRLITKAKLTEISLVTQPAYTNAALALRSRDIWTGQEALSRWEKRLSELDTSGPSAKR